VRAIAQSSIANVEQNKFNFHSIDQRPMSCLVLYLYNLNTKMPPTPERESSDGQQPAEASAPPPRDAAAASLRRTLQRYVSMFSTVVDHGVSAVADRDLRDACEY
jgi:hypothetical protein